MFKQWLVMMLIIASQNAFGLDCKSLIEQQIKVQLDTSNLFNASDAMVVVIVCAQKPLPVYAVMYTNLMSQEQLKKFTPVTTLIGVKQPINPNGKTITTGFLAVNREEVNSFTLRLRTRLATGEAIDIGKKMLLSANQFILFEDSEIHVGAVRIGLQ